MSNKKGNKKLDENILDDVVETTEDIKEKVEAAPVVEEKKVEDAKAEEPKAATPVVEEKKEEVKPASEERTEKPPVMNLDDKKEEANEDPKPVPVPVEPGPVIIEKKEEKKEEPKPVPVEPGPVIIEEKKEEKVIPPAAEYMYLLAVEGNAKSLAAIASKITANKKANIKNVEIDENHNRVVVEVLYDQKEAVKRQKELLGFGVKVKLFTERMN